ncbi:MAG TPA: SDR family NAD(P)-dependent oxidoreductase [Thermoleophilaceae bacterium]|jgi:NAD(P)-dependent dehydrogenase (short-subunit alcohol dehydrogenase family)
MSGAIVVGAGPGIGLAVSRRFAREGYPVGVIARSSATLAGVQAELDSTGAETAAAAADVTDTGALTAALDAITERFGVPDVLVYNAALIQWDEFGELMAQGHLDAWATNVGGAITAIGHLAPRMAARGSGTIIITGGMPTPIPEVTSLSLGKAGVRALAELLEAKFAPSGLHVATVTVAGAVAPGTDFDPDEIAERYWALHSQPPGEWEREVLYTGTPARSIGLDRRAREELSRP